MGRKGNRKRIANCVYEDGSGRSGIYRGADGKPKEVRFPPYTPIREIRARLEDLKAKAKGSGRVVTDRGTLNYAINRWNGLEQHLASWKERRAELRAWARLYGDKRLSQITADDVRLAMSLWTRQGRAPKTIRNRLWTLGHLFRVLHGPNFSTPVDDVDPPAKVRQIITPVDPTTILSVYQRLLEHERQGILRDAKSRARFMVLAATGRRPSEIMRTQPDDVDFGQRTWRVRDGKGGWSEGLFLNDDMLAAWQAFAEADAWGEYNTGSLAKVLRFAGWPAGIRPYQLRHSIGISLSESGHDLADVGGWLGHTDVRTTRSAYVPIRNSRMQRLSQSLDGRLNGWSVPSVVPRAQVPEVSKVLQRKRGRATHNTARNAG
jgi:site-specific recombinase XerD